MERYVHVRSYIILEAECYRLLIRNAHVAGYYTLRLYR